jgi:hypothetical protein
MPTLIYPIAFERAKAKVIPEDLTPCMDAFEKQTGLKVDSVSVHPFLKDIFAPLLPEGVTLETIGGCLLWEIRVSGTELLHKSAINTDDTLYNQNPDVSKIESDSSPVPQGRKRRGRQPKPRDNSSKQRGRPLKPVSELSRTQLWRRAKEIKQTERLL